MFWITKTAHNQIVENYKKEINYYKERLNEKEKIVSILNKLTYNITNLTEAVETNRLSLRDLTLDDTIPRYVEDYYGGRVIKQEATPVTILDSNGKATYGLTARKPADEKNYILDYKD